MIYHISVVIIAKYADSRLIKCLDSVQQFSDVVIYDNSLNNEVKEIADKYPNVNRVDGPFLGFGQTKNKAATYAKNDWVFSLDGDEVVNDELLTAIRDCKLSDEQIYTVHRIYFYRGKQINGCGLRNDVLSRIYNRKLTSLSDDIVHEKVLSKGFKPVKLAGFIEHYSHQGVSDFIDKMNVYSELFAQQNSDKKVSLAKIIYKSLFRFIKCYVFQCGFLAGYRGLLICVSDTGGVFYKYIKILEQNDK